MNTIIIPLAGLSSRFFNAGYKLPKFMLPISANQTMFEWSVISFKEYFDKDLFLFVCKDNYGTPKFIDQQIKKLHISNYEIVVLPNDTLGQADTVYQGISRSKNLDLIRTGSLYIFNIDSKLLNFKKAPFENTCDGYLEVFKEDGEQWSFVVPGDNLTVLKTTEKIRVSDLCSNGLYYFKNCYDFISCHEYLRDNAIFSKGELYIAPMYNYLISKNKNIKYFEIPRKDVVICGTPSDYVVLTNALQETM